MSTKIATGSDAPSVQKWIIESEENQLRSKALYERLQDEGLSHGSIYLSVRCPNLTALGRGKQIPFSDCPSLLRIDLSGCPKLESIPEYTFFDCNHLVSVVFGEHSNITNLGESAFRDCYALTSITLPDKLEVVELYAFASCTSLELVVCNKKLKTIGEAAFNDCSALTSITLPDKLEIIGEGRSWIALPCLQQKPQDYWRSRIPSLLLARRCPACIQLDFLRYISIH